MQRFNTGVRVRKNPRARGGRSAVLQATRKELLKLAAENRRLEDERGHTEHQIRERNLFLRSLSHELRAPLTAIIGFSELLASGSLPADSPKRAQFVEHIHGSGRHLLQLINDVLELSKLDTHGYEFNPEEIDLATLIANVVDLLHTRILRRRLHLCVDVAHEIAGVVRDPRSLKQAVRYHLSHAASIASSGSDINVRAQPQESDRFRLEVRFWPGTADGRPATDERLIGMHSTSLDLMLARRLIEAQGGETGESFDPEGGCLLYMVLHRFQAGPVQADRCEPVNVEPIDEHTSSRPAQSQTTWSRE